MSLKHMHPASFLGLALHLVCIAIIQAGLTDPQAASIIGDESTLTVITGMLKIMWFFIAVQTLAIILIVLKVPFGIYLAAIASVPNLPAAYIYFTGCALSDAAWKYAPFEEVAPKQAGQAGQSGIDAYPFAMSRALPQIVIAILVCGSLLTLFTNLFLGVTLVGAGCFLLYIQSRIKNRDALAFYNDYFVCTPGIFSKSIKISYQDVTRATLVKDNKAALEVMINGASALLYVSSGFVAQKDGQYAINTLGHMLLLHNVPLV